MIKCVRTDVRFGRPYREPHTTCTEYDLVPTNDYNFTLATIQYLIDRRLLRRIKLFIDSVTYTQFACFFILLLTLNCKLLVTSIEPGEKNTSDGTTCVQWTTMAIVKRVQRSSVVQQCLPLKPLPDESDLRREVAAFDVVKIQFRLTRLVYRRDQSSPGTVGPFANKDPVINWPKA